MKHTCNINVRGAQLRMWAAFAAFSTATILLVLKHLTNLLDPKDIWAELTAFALMIFGALCVYQSVNRWCVLVALMHKLGLRKSEGGSIRDAEGKH